MIGIIKNITVYGTAYAYWFVCKIDLTKHTHTHRKNYNTNSLVRIDVIRVDKLYYYYYSHRMIYGHRLGDGNQPFFSGRFATLQA